MKHRIFKSKPVTSNKQSSIPNTRPMTSSQSKHPMLINKSASITNRLHKFSRLLNKLSTSNGKDVLRSNMRFMDDNKKKPRERKTMELKSKLLITTVALTILGGSTFANDKVYQLIQKVNPAADPILSTMIHKAAIKNHVDPLLLASLISNESSFNNQAISSAGAIGYGQLMPETAAELGVNPNDPASNLDGSARYLHQMLQANNGNVRLALASYNAGLGNVQTYNGVPPFEETTNYVSNVSSDYATLVNQSPLLPSVPKKAAISSPKKKVVVYYPNATTEPESKKKTNSNIFFYKK
jgi:putative murein lytic transglycosylase yjbJ